MFTFLGDAVEAMYQLLVGMLRTGSLNTGQELQSMFQRLNRNIGGGG